jgi:hypothetical protein
MIREIVLFSLSSMSSFIAVFYVYIADTIKHIVHFQ